MIRISFCEGEARYVGSSEDAVFVCDLASSSII